MTVLFMWKVFTICIKRSFNVIWCLLRVINKNNNFLKGIFQMASNDGFIPYPIGLSANQSVIGIRNGYALPETLK